jgi:hypothetical protein
MFNVHPQTLPELVNGNIWKHGLVHCGSVTPASINYVTKYVIDREDEDEDQKPFSMMSKGLGAGYLDDNAGWHLGSKWDKHRNYMLHQGKRTGIPRYYKDRIFSKFEKQLLNLKCQEEEFKRFEEDMERLLQFGVEDPAGYLESQKQDHYNKIRIKSLKLNSL